MKKIIIYGVLLLVVLFLPLRGVDVGKLLPVEVIHIYKEEDMILIRTDVDASGRGATLGEAIHNLKGTTPGIIFMDTADYLLIDETAEEEIEGLKEYLKSSIRVCRTEREVDLTEAAAFLSVHKPGAKLRHLSEDKLTMECLQVEDGKMILK